MFTKQRAIENFTSAAIEWARGPVGLVASATVCFLIGAHNEQPETDTVAELRKAIEDAGLSAASFYRYTGLARKLAAKVTADGIDVTGERSPNLAERMILDWLDKEGADSVDAVSRMLGTYQRTPPKRKGETVEAEGDDSVSAKAEAAEVVTSGDPVKLIGEILHTFRLNHDKDSLIQVQNLVAEELLSLERSEKRASKSRRKATAQDGAHAHQ